MAKKHFSILIYILAALIVVSSNGIVFADVWSEPTKTEQWSTPTVPVPWSTPTTPVTPPPATPMLPATEVKTSNSSPSVYIKLQIGSKNAETKDKNIQLDVAPSTIGGRTMVPIRFLVESLDAKIGWEQKTQTVTVSLKDKTIILTIGKSTALVNGKPVQLDVPPVTKDGRTLVPLRFVSENLDLFLNYSSATQTIEIADQPFAKESTPSTAAAKPPANSTPAVKEQPPKEEPAQTAKDTALDFEKLYGTWYLWTSSTTTSLYDKTTGNYVTHELGKGADQGKITINKDGTYSMTHAAWAKGITAEGKWRLSYPSEINGEKIQAIVLINGITAVDWAVAPSSNGKIRLLYAMKWADGSATWVFDSEVYKK